MIPRFTHVVSALVVVLLALLLLAPVTSEAQEPVPAPSALPVANPEAVLDELGGSDQDPEELYDLDELSAPAAKDTVHRVTLRSRLAVSPDAHQEAGYLSGLYLGPPTGLSDHLIATSADGTWRMGLVQEKQPWEADAFDRVGGFIELTRPEPTNNAVTLEHVIAGDMTFSLGQGLLFGGGLPRVARSMDAVAGATSTPFGARGTLSTNSGRSERGLFAECGAMLSETALRLALFASRTSLDARVLADTIRTIYTTDLHQTPSELATRGAATFQLLGVRASVERPVGLLRVALGATAYEAVTQPARSYGSSLRGLSGDLRVCDSTTTLTAECASSAVPSSATHSALAMSTMLEVHVTARLGVAVGYRHVPEDLIAPYALIDGRSLSAYAGAEGYYLGLALEPKAHTLVVTGYAALAPKAEAVGGLWGARKRDELLSLFYTLTQERALTLTVRDMVSEGLRLAQTTGGGETILPSTTERVSLRLELQQHLSSDAMLRSRLELARLGGDSNAASVLGVEMFSLSLPSLHAWLDGSIGRFSSVQGSVAPSLFVRSVTGAGSVLSLGGVGYVSALSLRAHAHERVELSASAQGTFYDHTRLISAGGPAARWSARVLSLSAQLRIVL